MSKIALTPDVDGTGTLSIVSPNTNTNRTLTLPDETGTVLTSGAALPAISGAALTNLTSANLTGALPAIDGSALTGLAIELISTTTVSTAVATVDIAIPTSGYSFYRMIITNLTGSAASSVRFRTSSDGGSTFDAGASDYNNENNAGDAIYFANGGTPFSDADAEKGANIENTFINTAGFYFLVGTEMNYYRSSDDSAQYYSGPVSGVRNSATQVNAVRYFFNTGNITGGTFKLYGYT
jgi:hypothetical protein